MGVVNNMGVRYCFIALVLITATCSRISFAVGLPATESCATLGSITIPLPAESVTKSSINPLTKESIPVVPATIMPKAESATNTKQNTHKRKAPLVAAEPVKTWIIRADDRMISNTLNRWAQDNGYQLVWDTQVDYPVNAVAKIHGTFRYALNEVLKSFKYTKNPLKADWYRNNVIVIRQFN